MEYLTVECFLVVIITNIIKSLLPTCEKAKRGKNGPNVNQIFQEPIKTIFASKMVRTKTSFTQI